MSLYLFLNIASFLIPFLYSFEKRMRYCKRWKVIFPSLIITALFFIIWDIIFTQMGVWSFNPRYHSGIEFFGLPIEEWLFFICIPYASIFIHFSFQYFLPNLALSDTVVKKIYWFLMILIVPVAVFNYDRWYTFVNLSLFVIVLTIAVFKFSTILKTYFITFLIILIPFLLVNGILTGSFIEEPVVFYNDNENLGIRLGTIPVEDVGYAFTMLLMSLVLMKIIDRKNESI
ncbi:lycopene cyclase domain-containing protein [Flavobacterium aquariorum]|uniref:Lycopene cyclase domain-containing protein n=1 Tax=Flavobacterium aquariorum TaxID=2217670 RepID=A0A2W7TTG7_9FLAO|nr:lycopene cyclase domain-containing protein [Flavobacterium aquariorum]PZX92864.1 lycopene cyclase domain-containing protein [Flavobacterium aquariorum]